MAKKRKSKKHTTKTFKRAHDTKTRLFTSRMVNIDLQTPDQPIRDKTRPPSHKINDLHKFIVGTTLVKRYRKNRRIRNTIRSPVFSGLVNLKQKL